MEVRTRPTYRKRPFTIDTLEFKEDETSNYLFINQFETEVSYTYTVQVKQYYSGGTENIEEAANVTEDSTESLEALSLG